jgi:phosphatidylinositol glycan class H protein
MASTLTTRRPTPTTVLYTVSTASSSTSLQVRLRLLANGILRLAAFYLLNIFLISALPTPKHHDITTVFLNVKLSRLILQHLISPLPTVARFAIGLVAAWILVRRGHQEESLLVIRGLGVQTSSAGSTYLPGTSSTRFIPTSAIQDVLIHEAFKGFEVRFYLSIVVEGEKSVVVVFPVGFCITLYRLHMLADS